MASVDYEYFQPETSYTLDQYLQCKSDEIMNYANSSFTDTIRNINFASYNTVFDYIDEIRDEFCVDIRLTDEDLSKYKYRPKLLCYEIYGNTELAFIILLINDMYSAKQFTKKKIKMPTMQLMNDLTKYIMNANRNAIYKYNKKYALQ